MVTALPLIWRHYFGRVKHLRKQLSTNIDMRDYLHEVYEVTLA